MVKDRTADILAAVAYRADGRIPEPAPAHSSGCPDLESPRYGSVAAKGRATQSFNQHNHRVRKFTAIGDLFFQWGRVDDGYFNMRRTLSRTPTAACMSLDWVGLGFESCAWSQVTSI